MNEKLTSLVVVADGAVAIAVVDEFGSGGDGAAAVAVEDGFGGSGVNVGMTNFSFSTTPCRVFS